MQKHSIGNRLREERTRLGLTQKEAGTAAAVSFVSWQHYEKGERYPNAESLHDLYVIGFDVLYIITGDRNPRTLSKEHEELQNSEQAQMFAQIKRLDKKGRNIAQAVIDAYLKTEDQHG